MIGFGGRGFVGIIGGPVTIDGTGGVKSEGEIGGTVVIPVDGFGGIGKGGKFGFRVGIGFVGISIGRLVGVPAVEVNVPGVGGCVGCCVGPRVGTMPVGVIDCGGVAIGLPVVIGAFGMRPHVLQHAFW